jgi:hypothetical protein
MAADDADVEGRVAAHMRAMAASFQRVIENAVEKGELAPRVGAETAAWGIVNAVYGIGVLGHGGVGSEATRPVIDMIRNTLGLGPGAVPRAESA